MDNKLTEKIQSWLDTPEDNRDYDLGALFLLQLSNNQIMYRNISRNAKKHAHEPAKPTVSTNTEVSSLKKNPTSTNGVGFDEACGGTANSQQDNKHFKAGKRLDHDSLPVEIQALYIENGNIIHKMRELHLQLRQLSKENATCPDSERYPFLKELIALDKTYHKNWQIYDSWTPQAATTAAQSPANTEQSSATEAVPSTSEPLPAQATTEQSQSVATAQAAAPQSLNTDERQNQKNIYRQINLTKGRYKKNPSDALKEQLAALYSQLASPTETLTLELRTLHVIE